MEQREPDQEGNTNIMKQVEDTTEPSEDLYDQREHLNQTESCGIQ